MLNSLFDKSIEELKGIGPYYQKKLKALRIKTIRDFLRHFPSRYEDFSQLKKISELEADGVCSVFAKIEKIKTRKSFKKRLFITEAVLKDETGEVPVTWFGQPFLMKSLKAGVLVIVSGKVVSKEDKISFQSPVFEIVSRDQEEFESAEIHFEKLKHTFHSSTVYFFFPSFCLQLIILAIILAALVLPEPRGPTKR